MASGSMRESMHVMTASPRRALGSRPASENGALIAPVRVEQVVEHGCHYADPARSVTKSDLTRL